jgi:hypothetical protein
VQHCPDHSFQDSAMLVLNVGISDAHIILITILHALIVMSQDRQGVIGYE